MSKSLLVFATVLESEAFLRDGEDKTKSFYETTHGDILITGMGRKALSQSLAPFLDSYSTFYNIGFFGGLSKRVVFNEVYLLGDYKLYTLKEPLHRRLTRDQLGQNWDLVDMEGDAFIQLVSRKNHYLLKIVSDSADENTSITIKTHASYLSKKLLSSFLDFQEKLIRVRTA